MQGKCTHASAAQSLFSYYAVSKTESVLFPEFCVLPRTAWNAHAERGNILAAMYDYCHNSLSIKTLYNSVHD